MYANNMSGIATEGIHGELVWHTEQIDTGDKLIAVDASEYPTQLLATIAVKALERTASGLNIRWVDVTYEEDGTTRPAFAVCEAARLEFHAPNLERGDKHGVIGPPFRGISLLFYRVENDRPAQT